jgi:phospholipid-binding lipoprotein MlaA
MKQRFTLTLGAIVLLLLGASTAFGASALLTPPAVPESTLAERPAEALWAAAPSAGPASPGPVPMDGDDDFADDLDAEAEGPTIADPLYYWNKGMYHFNDKFYLWLWEPLARGYRAIAPEVVRMGVRNFFNNLTTPIRLVSCLLQGRWESAGTESGRLLVNTTLGVLGFGDPAATRYGLPLKDEDLGQTFGYWGIGNGFYLVWPILGPSSLRDTAGMVGDSFLHPVSYLDPTALSVGLKAYDNLNRTTFRIGDYQSLKQSALDPYVAIRNAYAQHRQKKVDE